LTELYKAVAVEFGSIGVHGGVPHVVCCQSDLGASWDARAVVQDDGFARDAGERHCVPVDIISTSPDSGRACKLTTIVKERERVVTYS
jgi:hypothetical protein